MAERIFYPLRPIQRMLVDTHLKKAKSTMMNIGALMKLPSGVDMERLAEAINETLRAHDIFKCRLEFHPETSIATFRVDIDVSTCGEITPLQTLDYLIGRFDSDIITMDYRVRGFTRDLSGKKLFIDTNMTSIQEFINRDTLDAYDAVDINMYQANLFHTRMLIKEPDLQNYLFNTDIYEIPPKTRLEISSNIRREMIEIFSGKNIY